jgi:hypothetical protein
MEYVELKNNEVLMKKEIAIDKFIDENKEMFEQGLFKLNLLPTILYELKHKYNRKWLIQCDSENLYPDDKENDKPNNYDNWVYTDNIAESVTIIDDASDCIVLLDNAKSWVRWVSMNGTSLDCLCDWTTYGDLDFLNEITSRPEFEI